MWKCINYNIYYTFKIVPKIIDLPCLVRFPVFSVILEITKASHISLKSGSWSCYGGAAVMNLRVSMSLVPGLAQWVQDLVLL